MLGAVELQNRVVMAPLTRARAHDERTASELMRQYYVQRASAGLIITEATAVSHRGAGYPDTPGMWCTRHVESWQRITDAVHRRGGKIIMQLRHVGRVADPEFTLGQIPIAPSAIACPGKVQLDDINRAYPVPRALRTEEIPGLVEDFANSAAMARDAGFDGVLLHAGNGYLIDQFLHESSNQRTDDYGGSIENRCRLLMDIVDACAGLWGADRVGVSLSPYGKLHGMQESSPLPLFLHIAQCLSERALGFLFVRQAPGQHKLTLRIKQAFSGCMIVNQGFDQTSAQQAIDSGLADAVAFGKAYIANPDLVERFSLNVPLNDWDRQFFYGGDARGYTDYPFYAGANK